MVKEALSTHTVIFAEQTQQLGTGHAVKMALPHLPKEGKSLILYGDVPLTQAETLQNLVKSQYQRYLNADFNCETAVWFGSDCPRSGQGRCHR